MDVSIDEVVDYWARHRSESGMSVDWAEAHFLCWRCAHKRQLQRCHIVPKSLGGPDAPENLVLLCRQCHAEAPNVADSEFMWTWLKAHAVPFYGTYWHVRGFREYEVVFGRKPFEGLSSLSDLDARLKTAARKLSGRTSTHWGQGKLNPATVAWLIRQVELDLLREEEHGYSA
jgi:hypothetical protein